VFLHNLHNLPDQDFSEYYNFVNPCQSAKTEKLIKVNCNYIEKFKGGEKMKKIVFFKLALLFSVILALPISTAGTVLKITNNLRNDDAHEIVVDFCGNSYVTWQGWDGNDWEIYWAKIDSSETLQCILQITDNDDVDNLPKIAVDRCGYSYVTWRHGLAEDADIYWVRVNPLCEPGDIRKISNHPDNTNSWEFTPRIGVDVQGNSYVAYRGWDKSDPDYEIYLAKVDPSGVVKCAEKISIHPDNTDHNEEKFSIAVDVLGNSYVAYNGYDGNDWEIYWVKVGPSCEPGDVVKISDHPKNRNDNYPEIAVDAQGNSYIAWQRWNDESESVDIYWAKIDPSGDITGPYMISNHPDNTNNDYEPQIAADYHGNSYVTWYGWDGNDWEIYWVKVDSSCEPGDAVKISTHDDNINNNESHPDIAVDYHGNSYVAYRGYDGTDQEIYWVKVDPSGGTTGPYKISTHPDNENRDDLDARIAADGCGKSYVVWKGGDGNDWEIYWVIPAEPGPCC